MQMHEYVAEKLRELEGERVDSLIKMRMAETFASKPRGTSKSVIGPVLRAAGRTLRRAGEGLEGWGSPEPDGERRLHAERRTG